MVTQHKDSIMSNSIEAWHHFTSPIYNFKKPEFLEIASKVCEEYLEIKRKDEPLNEIYPLYNTDQLSDDDRLTEMAEYTLKKSWEILDSQGYNMNLYKVHFHDFWCQEHNKHSGHERHIHSSLISGFYFINTPPKSCLLIIHEPRAAKEYINLAEKDQSQASYASNMINFVPEAGTFIFTNSWLPHSFTKNESDEPFRMIHFNVGASYAPLITFQEQATII